MNQYYYKKENKLYMKIYKVKLKPRCFKTALLSKFEVNNQNKFTVIIYLHSILK